MRVHACISACALKLSICTKGAQCCLRTKSVLSFLGGANSIIRVGSDLILLCSVVYKLVTTNAFNCYNTVFYVWCFNRTLSIYFYFFILLYNCDNLFYFDLSLFGPPVCSGFGTSSFISYQLFLPMKYMGLCLCITSHFYRVCIKVFPFLFWENILEKVCSVSFRVDKQSIHQFENIFA